MAVTSPLTAPALLRSVGLLADGPAVWGRPFAASGPGVFAVELAAPLANAPIELTRIGKWIERMPTFRLDGVAPSSSRAVVGRMASFWIPSTTVLYIGSSTTSIAGRVAAIEATALGDRRPYAGGHWLKTLTGLERARVWWARTDAVEEYEDALFGAFAEAIPADDRARLHDRDVVLPFANLRSTAGDRKAHGLTGYLVPEDTTLRRVTTRVTELPPGDADGASGLPPTRAAGGTTRRAPRAARPAVARATRGPTVAAPPNAGSTTSAAPEAAYLSAEGIARLRDEHAALTTVKRPEVIARIKTAKELGDLRENADYTAAREEQSFLEGRIATIEALLRSAVVIETPGADGRVHVGSSVKVEEVDGDGSFAEYRIVGSAEADPSAGRISNASPVGRALLGRSVGEVVAVVTPRGDARYRIVAVD
jgi:transcription elongation factor GreA